MFASHPDLFQASAIPGLSLREDFVTPAEERTLIAAIEGIELSPFRFQGWVGKRLTASFGWRYDFEDSSFRPTEPIPGFLQPLRTRSAALAGLSPDDLVQVLLIRYDRGAGIGWHRDRPVFDHVIGISLGEEAPLRFRRRREKGFERVNVPLAPRSAYHLTGEVRHEWEHSIAPLPVRRWSVTFRSLSEKGRKVAQA